MRKWKPTTSERMGLRRCHRTAGTHGLVRQVVLRRQAVLPWQSVPYRKRGAISFRRFIEYDITTLHGLSHDAAADRHAMIWTRIPSYPPV